MKTKFFALFLFLLVGAGTQTKAQISECTISYTMEITGEDVDPMAAMMMKGAEMTMAFKGEKGRFGMDMSMMKTTAIVDGEAKKGVVLMDMMGQKMAMVMGESDFEEEDQSDMKIRETGKTKKIAGYTCKQVIASDSEGNEFEIWYTPEIKVDATNSGYDYKGIEGFPLEMEALQDGMLVKLQATDVDKSKISDSMFDTSVPDGYTITTADQLGGGR